MKQSYVNQAWLFALCTVLAFVALMAPMAALAQDVGGDSGPPLSGLSNEALWSLLIGIGVPWITAIINRRNWASDVKLVCFFVVTLVTTGVTVLIRGDLDASNYIRTFLLILVSAALTFQATKPAVHTVEERTG